MPSLYHDKFTGLIRSYTSSKPYKYTKTRPNKLKFLICQRNVFLKSQKFQHPTPRETFSSFTAELVFKAIFELDFCGGR